MTEVPLPETCGGIALRLEVVCNRMLFRVQPFFGCWKQHVLVHAHTFRITTCHQRRSGGRANGGGHHETREFSPLFCQTIDVGRLDRLRTKTTQVTVTLVIGKNNDEIGSLSLKRNRQSPEYKEKK